MSKLHKNPNSSQDLEHNEGQRGFLCSNKTSCRCPSLCYKASSVLDPKSLEQAYFRIFDWVLENKDSKLWKKQKD
ncbi:MAG: hypothetical protein COV29_00255 [Candidatus Yanofskybacteria bacterium CG10_big_fil_rev_8_21_14_0_10_36_16]|uniref:Uncharacterized protein n=1 Tax=Candidatus Yanofskybacteria bacterium CG10_big_fil_rev_8_21_14_0_10_36_16 TaxID=1975096 RepID=A0A2J0Q8L9_9BACT|nr:MAG: hypothetical protein COV29_00255 [Candidatus Yanofskybacteria bacterium CG10_big_fil_rev_8_21_14_0_10_36_16]